MEGSLIDQIYLPFLPDALRRHFLEDFEGHLKYYQNSAKRYFEFNEKNNGKTAGIPISRAKTHRQIEKDERFWTVTATKNIFDDPTCNQVLSRLLESTYGPNPPFQTFSNWGECLKGPLELYYEACLPSPPSYINWLRNNLKNRQMIPYVIDAADRENGRTLEGPTHVDALFLNPTNGFAWLIEAKVLSDVSYLISFDNLRNQISRNIDVMLENTSPPDSILKERDPEKSLFALLTPSQFKENPHSRLYGWLFNEYKSNPMSVARDLIHREGVDWVNVSKRIGWLTFEEIEGVRPGTCPWFTLNTGKTGPSC
jgi:hypothetical protein